MTKKKTIIAEFQVPVRESDPRLSNIVMPAKCPDKVAELIGEGYGAARIRDGVRKYRLLRQCLLDTQVRRMATGFRFKDVTPKHAQAT